MKGDQDDFSTCHLLCVVLVFFYEAALKPLEKNPDTVADLVMKFGWDRTHQYVNKYKN